MFGPSGCLIPSNPYRGMTLTLTLPAAQAPRNDLSN